MGEGGKGGGEDAEKDNMTRLKEILDQFEITIAEANDLVALSDYEIVVIADDSGSMSLASCPPQMRQLGVSVPSRWDELKTTCSLLVELGNCFDDSGLDVFFLNRKALQGIKGAGDKSFVDAFAQKPAGTTPLTECLLGVTKAMSQDAEKPVLLFILTDGEPNGGTDKFCQVVQDVVLKRCTPRTFKIQIMACTDEEDAVAWMGDLDKRFSEVDVTDDYYSEKQEVIAAGRVAKFTRGDWLIKAMLGPISKKFDGWDEKGGGGGSSANPASACCTIL